MTASTVQPRAPFASRLARLLGVPAPAGHVALAIDAAAPVTTPARCFLTADVDGHRARVCELTDETARVELSVPLDLDRVTLTVIRDGQPVARRARVVSYRRHPDGPASYGLQFAND